MTFRVVRGALADAEIDDFGRYAADYSEELRESNSLASIASLQSTSQKPLTLGDTFTSPARHTAHIFSASGGEQVIGSSIPSMTTQRSSMCCAFGTPAGSLNRSRPENEIGPAGKGPVVDRTPSATHDQRAGALSRQSPARTLRRGPSQGRPAGMSADRFPPAPAYVNSVSVRLATREGRANAVRDALMSAPRPSATATPRPEGP
jgi:hypothetical protein